MNISTANGGGNEANALSYAVTDGSFEGGESIRLLLAALMLFRIGCQATGVEVPPNR